MISTFQHSHACIIANEEILLQWTRAISLFFNFFSLLLVGELVMHANNVHIINCNLIFFLFTSAEKNSLSFALFYEWKMKWKIGSAARDMLRWRWVMKCVYHMIFLTFALISFSYYFTSALSFTFFSHHHAWYRFFCCCYCHARYVIKRFIAMKLFE